MRFDDAATSADSAGDGQLVAPQPGRRLTTLDFIPQRNQVYEAPGGLLRRLLHLERRLPGETKPLYAWLIDLGEGNELCSPWPLERGIFLAHLQARDWIRYAGSASELLMPRSSSVAARALAEHRWNTLHRKVDLDADGTLVSIAEDLRLLEKKGRKCRLELYRNALGVSDKSLLAWLRMYWQGGLNRDALLPLLKNCGDFRPEVVALRRAPGRKRHDGGDPFHFTKELQDAVWTSAERHLKKYRSLKAVYGLLVGEKWSYVDQNGQVRLLPEGQAPSLRQFYLLARARRGPYGAIKAVSGKGKWENDYEGRTGGTLNEAICVGHQYEIDSTQADIWLVASENENKIIGKPTLYFIVDRFSRYVVGWHATLDAPSWYGAMEAFLSIFEKREDVCEELGVLYKDHVYVGVGHAPSELVADRGGDNICESAEGLPEDLHTDLVTIPAHMCPPKGTVECTFMQNHVSLQRTAAGYQPPAEALKRHGDTYEHDAEWTLKRFRAEVLAFVNKHNEKIHPRLLQRMHALSSGVRPCPVEVWRNDEENSQGMLTQLELTEVYWALISRRNGVVTPEGIRVNGLYYTCREIEEREWLVRAGIKRFKVPIRYDRRSTDHIYVIDPSHPEADPYKARLTPKYEMFGRRSVAEATALLRELDRMRIDAERENLRLELQYDFEARGREEQSHRKAQASIAEGKARGESRTSGRPEIRGREASADSLAFADKRTGQMTGPNGSEDAAGGQNNQPRSEDAQQLEALPESLESLVVIPDPMQALRQLGTHQGA